MQGLIRKHESSIAAKQKQIADLEQQRSAAAKAQQESDTAKAALQVKVDALFTEIKDRDRERSDATVARHKLEKEMDDLRKLMADKSSEDVRRKEAERSREAEMNRLREQVAAGDLAREEQQKKQTEFANALRVKVESLQSLHKSTDKELKAVQAALADKEKELSRVKVEQEKLDEARRAGEKDLLAVREQLKSTETRLLATNQARNVSKQLQHVRRRADVTGFREAGQRFSEPIRRSRRRGHCHRRRKGRMGEKDGIDHTTAHGRIG